LTERQFSHGLTRMFTDKKPELMAETCRSGETCQLEAGFQSVLIRVNPWPGDFCN
jgi:hypothetical protein